jgi:hypothetical protein
LTSRSTTREERGFSSLLAIVALLAGVVALLGGGRSAEAHQAGMGLMMVDFREGSVGIGYRLDGTTLANHLHLIAEDRLPTAEELAPGMEAIARYLAEHLRVVTDGVTCGAFVIDELEPGPADTHFVDVAGHIDCPQRLGLVELTNTVLLDALPDYQTYAIMRAPGGRRLETLFDRRTTSARVPVAEPVPPGSAESAAGAGSAGATEGSGGAAPSTPGETLEEASGLERFGRFVVLGIEHIVPKGTDHILFIIGLTLAAVSFRRLLGIVTAFTLSHSLTLGLAAFEVVRVPISLAEAAIALSVAWVGLENIVHKPKRRWILAFAFGLIHGIGFSSVLGDLVAGTDVTVAQRVQELLGFNVGVEIGQVMIVAVVFPLVLAARRFKVERWLVVPASLGVFGFGAVWFLERVGIIG